MAKRNIKELDKQYNQQAEYTQPLNNTYGDDIFAALESDVVSEITLPIMDIIPDATQPRRILPQEIRRDWNGTAQGYGAMIDAWESRAHKGIKWSYPVDILIGKASLPDLKTDDPLVLDFAELLGFAANIRDIGLNHPIGVVKRGNYYRIVFGERRWTGFQILNHYLGESEDWSNIPVKIATAGDWELAKAQAAENNQSKRLNAIGRAREFAKLLMIARTDGGEHYDSWDQLVVPGGCDRAWYAQVANGELHRIPRNLGPQFEQSLNISETTMRKYRGLLRLFDDHELSNKVNDAIWMLGDAGKWAEGFMRDIRQYLSVEEVDEILNLTGSYTVPIGTVYTTESALFKAVKAKKEAEEEAKKAAELAKKQAKKAATLAALANSASGDSETVSGDAAADSDSQIAVNPDWASAAWVNKLAYSGPVKVFVKTASAPNMVIVTTEDGQDHEVNVTSLSEYTEPATPAEPAKPTPLQAAKDWTSRAVQTVAGAIALVQKDAFGVLTLKFPDDSTSKLNKEFASLVEMTEWWAAVKRFKAAQNGGDHAGANNTGSAATTTATTASPQTTGGALATEDAGADDNTDTGSIPVSDADPRLIVQAIANMASILELPEQIILDDLAKLNTERLEAIMYDGGFGVLEQLTDGYYKAAKDAVEKIRRYVEAYIDEIVAAGREMTEEE